MLDTITRSNAAVADLSDKDLGLPANCYTATYGGAAVGISLKEEPGPDLLRPRAPSVCIGHRFIPVDYRDGAVVHRGDQSSTIRRAMVHQFETPKGQTIKTLRRPLAEASSEVLVMVNCGMPSGYLLRPIAGADGKAYTLAIQRGLHHDGNVVMAEGDNALVRLQPGQFLCVLFPDGLVRKFAARTDGKLVEENLSMRQMAMIRVSDAKKRLDNLGRKPDFTLDDVKRILSGMVDLFHRLRGDAYARAREEVQAFFFKDLSDEYLSLVHRKLTAVLHVVDPVMVTALNGSDNTTAVPAKTGSKDPDAAANRAAAEARRAANRAERDALSQRMKGSSSGGGESKGNKKKK